MAGSEVHRLQERLLALGFQPGPIDGQFGGLTEMAVWAYQKLVMGVPINQPDGVVTPEMSARPAGPAPRPRAPPRGRQAHRDLPAAAGPRRVRRRHAPVHQPPRERRARGAAARLHKGQGVVRGGHDRPGENGNDDGTEPIKKGVCGNSWTPGGVYEFYRKVDGKRESRLGGMQNPVYFNYGIAVHGAYNVRRSRRRTAASACRTDLHDAPRPRQHRRGGVRVGRRRRARGLRRAVRSVGLARPDYTTTTTSTTTTTTAPVAPPVTAAPTRRRRRRRHPSPRRRSRPRLRRSRPHRLADAPLTRICP